MRVGIRRRLPMAVLAIGLVCAAILPFIIALPARGASSQPPSEEVRCEACHDKPVYRVEFPRSVHGNNGCTSCHTDISDLSLHMEGRKRPAEVDCGRCHGEIQREFRKSVHFISLSMRCQDCHRDIHAIRGAAGNFKLAVQQQCTSCHSGQDYVMKGHGKALLAGNQDAATCSDCHGLHDIPHYLKDKGKEAAEARELHMKACWKCHTDEAMMARNRLSARWPHLYEQTYHGKINEIGYPDRVAGCADCHGGHNILPKGDSRSSLDPGNLAAACGKCHSGFNTRFVAFEAHPDYHDRRTYPGLFWTFVFMAGLLISVFFFFWVHTFLWWRRAYWEKCGQAKAGFVVRYLPPECREELQIQRFSPKERVMHILLMASFFTLVMTGFPLKYHDTAWAKALMGLWGGVRQAGIFHRAAALLLSALFLYTVWLCIKFLFPRGQGSKGWFRRLMGPDSLFPNMKDIRDMKAMFLWFFNRGEMPKFDRWTYWEKFDFFAVFWGMVAIGLSGLMLWFPEIFSWILPGWVINIATVVHSEEAFLAAIFIFTVHFFNNHFVPNKFPMEPNIFTGRYTLETLMAERPLEYERLVAEGRLDSLKREGPGVLTQLMAAAVGLGSLLLGIFLTLLIFWAAFFH